MADESIRINLPPFSMFSKTWIYEDVVEIIDGAVTNTLSFGLMQSPVTADPTDEVYTVTKSGVNRLDLIANKFYKQPALWWVIARVNSLDDPLVGFEAGTVIRVPSSRRLASLGLLNL